jgi:hypothetical protein
MNIQFLKCYKVAFKKENLIHNLGFYILGAIICLFLICLFLFCFKYYKLLITKINSIFIDKNDDNNNNKGKIEHLMTSDKKEQLKIEDLNNEVDKKQKKIIPKKKIKRKKKKKNQIKLSNILEIQNNKENSLNSKNFDDNHYLNKDNNNSYKDINKNNLDKDTTKNNLDKDNKNNNLDDNNKEINGQGLGYNNKELNALSYEDALKNDKRTYIQYYISLLKTNHLLIFSFYPFKDYNSQIIKIFLFFFCFASDLVINALFFTDATMNKIYYDEGSFDIIYNIPQIIYSLLISIVINALIKFLSLSEKKVISVKEAIRKNLKDLDIINKKLFKVLKIKFALFFIITFIILIIYWSYITCFCAIYKNTQIYLIKDTVSSFAMSLLTPFAIFFIPGIFRRFALKAEKMNRNIIYKISQLLENL